MMTDKEKAKAYNEVRKKIALRFGSNVAEEIFSEFEMSEDEKIRKEIISIVKSYRESCITEGNHRFNNCIAWLEKQKEPELSEDLGEYITELSKQFPEISFAKLSRIAVRVKNWLEKQGEQKPADKAKPFDKYEGLTDFERTLADICIGWIGEELGWKQYIKDNANVLLKIAIEKFNSVQDTPFEQKPIIEMKSAEESLGISSEEYNDIVNEYLYGESESSDKVELKFKVGDWITNGDYTWKIIEVKPLDYILQSQDGNIVDDTISHVDEQFHSFTIKDAKDGDVLVDRFSKDNVIILYKGINPKLSVLAYCGWNGYNLSIKTNGLGYGGLDNTNYLPATKEQRDLFFSKMKEAGYTFDFEKKDLKKVEQNPAWSEEDVKKIDRAIWLIEHDASHGWIRELREDAISGLKSLKQKIKL